MVRKLIKIMLVFMILIIPSKGNALSTADVNERIDLTRDCSLTLNYSYDNYEFNGIDVKIYYVASVTSDFRYHLSSDFISYPISINGIKINREWTSLEQTLNAYIEADGIKEMMSFSIENNKIMISDLKPGLYFVKTEKIDTEDYTLLFDSFLISIPNLSEDGSWNYDVLVYPKVEEYVLRGNKINYSVIKEWNDDLGKRPDSVDIEIYKDGLLVDAQVLSSLNNWTYKWETDDDGSEWIVVERNIPSGYNVSILKKDRSFIIVNTDSNYKEGNPETLDDIKLYLYLFVGSLFGFVLLIISLFMKKKYVK